MEKKLVQRPHWLREREKTVVRLECHKAEGKHIISPRPWSRETKGFAVSVKSYCPRGLWIPAFQKRRLSQSIIWFVL